jgi:predicted acetyltransferase
MIEYRLLTVNEYDKAIALADRVFRDAEHISMGEAFPQVFSPALNQSYGAFLNGELITFIGLVPSVVYVGPAEIQAYSIGAVCTDPEYRKKGHADTLLKKIFDHVRKANASVLFVSGTLPMYLKAGCSFYGRLNKYEIQESDLVNKEDYIVREMLPFDWFQLRKLMSSRFVHFEQSILEFSTLNLARGFASIHKMNHKVLVAESGNEIKGFLIFAVPSSASKNVPARVIEWGGAEDAVCAILEKSFQYGGKTIKFSVPAYENKLNQLLSSVKKEETVYPGTVKIMNLELFLEQLEPFLSGKMEIKNVDENHKELRINQKLITLDNDALEKWLLLGEQNSDFFLNNIFPIPLPFPEGLNYV